MIYKNTKYMILIIFLLIFAITLIFINISSLNNQEHQKLLQNIITIKNINNKLDKNILFVRAGIIRHYNSLDNGFNELYANIKILKNNFNLASSTTNKTLSLFTALHEQTTTKEEHANRLKSDVGVLRNSLMYFSLINDELNHKMIAMQHSSSMRDAQNIIMDDISSLNTQIIRILRDPTSLDTENLLINIDLLKRKTNNIKNKYFKNNLSLLAKHITVILNHSLEVNEILTALSNTKIEEIIDEIHARHIELFNINNEKINTLQFVAYLLVFTLFLFSTKLIIQISSATSSLHEMANKLGYQKKALDEHAIVTIVNKDGDIIEANENFLLTFHLKEAEIIGKPHYFIKPHSTNNNQIKNIIKVINAGDIWQGEIKALSKNRNVVWLNQTIVPFKDADDSVYQYITIGTDVTSRKQAELNVKHNAFHDILTNLPNRRLMVDRIEQAISLSIHHKHIGCFIFVDLDRFKTINDSLGHKIGDELLKQVSERLSDCIANIGTVARFGSNEFAILLPEIGLNINQATLNTQQISDKIQRYLSDSYFINDNEIEITCSIGISMFPIDSQEANTILRCSDVALSQSKDAGRNCSKFYDLSMQSIIEQRMIIESDLKAALINEDFLLYIQPQYQYNGDLIGAEVLLRWDHPEKGIISPVHFIPVAEETGIIISIGQWVLEKIFLKVHQWNKLETSSCRRVAINISPVQLQQNNFVSIVEGLIRKTKVNPNTIEFEITESILVNNVDEVIFKINQINAMGINFSIDDFGTGYSSLSYLHKLPLSKVKIDQSFIRNIDTTPNNETIVHTIISMAKNLNMEIIAEGVETKEELEYIYNLGCSNFQGYYFNKPMPIEEFEKILIENKD